MERLRWGILGPGRIAPRLVRAIGTSDRAELVAIASRDAERARAFAARHGVPRAWGAYDALLADPDVDVVYIALPNHLHAAWTIRALEAGKHVLCEKPLALSVAEVDAIAAAAERAGRFAVEAFMYLHHPQTIAAVDLARSGALGPLVLVNASFSFLLTHPDDPRLEPVDGRRLALGRRLLPGEPRAAGRGRGARRRAGARTLRRAGRGPHVLGRDAVPRRPPRPVRQRLRRPRPTAGRDRRARRVASS